MNRYKETKKATVLGLIGNTFLLIIKLIISFITNSQAMFGDALNSAGDIFSSFMAYIGNKIASKEADSDHNLGHGKAEYIFSLIISMGMIIVPIELFINSLKSIIYKTEYNFNIWLIVVCVVTIVVKFSLYLYTSNAGKHHKNIIIKANSKDHRNDCFLTTFNLVAQICAYYKIYLVDGIVGMGLSVFICITGIKLFKESYDVLMDKSLDEDTKKKIMSIIKTYPEIVKVNHFNSTPVGYKYQVSLTIFVDGNLKTYESHKIANSLEKEITKIDSIYLCVIHVNPIETKNNKKK